MTGREERELEELTSRYFHDYLLMGLRAPRPTPVDVTRGIEGLLRRDKQREKDGFPPKVKLGRLVQPGENGSYAKVVPVVPQEKFVHVPTPLPGDPGQGLGAGDGDEGDLIGVVSQDGEDGDGSGAGKGGGGDNPLEVTPEEYGRMLAEHLELPNLEERAKKRIAEETYKLRKLREGEGIFYNLEESMLRLFETNLVLGRITVDEEIDPTRLLMLPDDEVYKVHSIHRTYTSQALVFLVRDYSGSMIGVPTEVARKQHFALHSILAHQYRSRAERRFILHHHEAKEAPDAQTYFRSSAAGGTRVASAFELLNDIVRREGLARDYNIYVFYATDGDDWPEREEESVEAIVGTLGYANRLGITVVGRQEDTTVSEYLAEARLAQRFPERFRLDTFTEEEYDDERVLESIRRMFA